MVTKIEQYSQRITPEEQQIYDHLLCSVQLESPGQMIERFRALFINGLSYSHPEVLAALDIITAADSAEQCFKLFLNRLCRAMLQTLSQPLLLHPNQSLASSTPVPKCNS